MNTRTGVSMRSRSILPLRRSLIDANMQDQGKLQRKPYVPAKTREELMEMLQAGWKKNKLRQAHIKFLHGKGMGLDEISQRLSCTLITAMKYTEPDFLASNDPWPVAPGWWAAYDEESAHVKNDPVALETIARLHAALSESLD